MDYEAKQAARKSAAAALVAANPGLVAVGSIKGDGLNVAAKNIRIELKAAFPAIKFSIKSSRFSMGDSITVRWIDGPVSSQVEEIIGKYSAGHFNGQEDMYEYSADAWLDAFGDAKFVHACRDLSDKAIASAIRTAIAKGKILPGNDPAELLPLYRKGMLYNVPAINGQGFSRSEMVSDVISRIAYGRTWALSKAPAARVAA